MLFTTVSRRSCTSVAVGCIAFSVALTAMAPAARAQTCPTCPPTPVIPTDPVCSFILDPDDPYGLCPDGYKMCSASCNFSLCCYTCILKHLDCPNVHCPKPLPPDWECEDIGYEEFTCPPTCPGPGCWLYVVKTSHCPPDEPVQIGSLVTFSLCHIDCDLPGDALWSICAGSGDIVSTTDECATVRVTGAGLLVVNAFTADPCFHFQIESQVPVEDSCVGDITDDGTVDINDLLAVINNYGSPGCGGATPCVADLDCNGSVDTNDLLMVINQWGCS